jgi:hypothetical protein
MHGARDGAAEAEEGVVVTALFLALASTLAVVDEEDTEEPELQ